MTTKRIRRSKPTQSAIVKAQAEPSVNTVEIKAVVDLERLVEVGVRQLFKLFGGKQ